MGSNISYVAYAYNREGQRLVDETVIKPVVAFFEKEFGYAPKVTVESIADDWGLLVAIYDKNKQYYAAYFSLTEMPGCCAFLVSHGTYIQPEFRKHGLANLLQDLKWGLAKATGYAALYGTTIAKNDAQNHILPKHGWKKVDETLNRRTGNTVITWKKEI